MKNIIMSKNNIFMVMSFALTTSVAQAGVTDIVAKSIGSSIGKVAFSGKSVEQQLVDAATGLNKTLPVLLQNDIRMDHVVAGPGLRVTYYETYTAARASEVTKEQRAEGLAQIGSAACADKNMQNFFKNDVVVSYVVRGNDGGSIGSVDIAKSNCEKRR